MTLCDAGPLFALIDPRQAAPHAACKAVLPRLSSPLITTWPSFAEAMYLAGRAGGWPMQRLLWGFVERDALAIHESGPVEVRRMLGLMEQYRDTPMDLADASSVAVAEVVGLSRIFTLDGHFRLYRIAGSGVFEVVP